MGNHNIRVDAIGLAAEVVELRNEIARLKNQTNWVCKCGGTDCEGQKENADLRNTLDAVIWADERGVELWRAAHPGKELVIPDRAKLLEWLLEQNAALRQALEDMPTCRCGLSTDEQCALSVQNAALREVLNLTVDRLMFYMECIPMAHKDYIKTLEGKISYEIVNKSLILLKKEAQP